MEQPTLLDTMSRLAEQRCDDLLSAARAEAEAIRAAGEEERRTRREAALAEAREAMGEELRRSRERAAAEAEKHALVMQEMIVDELLQKVDERLAKIAEGAEFGPILRVLLEEALQDAEREAGQKGAGGFVVLVPAAYGGECQEWLNGGGHTGARVEPEPSLRDGVIVEDGAHTFRIVNTLSGRFARVREEARSLCLEQVFGERRSDGA